MSRRVFYIDVGDLKPDEAFTYLEKLHKKLEEEKKKGQNKCVYIPPQLRE